MDNLFDVSAQSELNLQRYLSHLKCERQNPSLDYLNKLIFQHQHTVPFENLSRICDFHEQPAKFPDLNFYIQRMASIGTGGVCWSHARAFHWLLKALGFETHYLYMEPGHVCLKVELDQEYYVEVGYGAPIFQAMPLSASFTINSNAEQFFFDHQKNFVLVVRTPGPTKKLLLEPVTSKFLQIEFDQKNIWRENRFLSMLLIAKFSNEKVVRLKDDILSDYREETLIERKLNDAEIEKLLEDFFQIDPRLYFRAKNHLRN